ncbi:class I lanthipeptide [Chitinophaga nivalis]|uniref:Class I lanthipeptide n=1 Tax=Chitinophaga nivalis TaxID=2991709 RepID=A0ABT3ILY7_9BACT|nr:class I lanthipeptide [Chitinophaga nivalis]MCW3465560.1 class I lanthipeptide [Chitinophaga nivalis]MCW3484749.1 class I lanthipeptide [Chitinophaga nivalis]
MKRTKIPLSKKLFLDRNRIAALNVTQQLQLEGGAPGRRAAATLPDWLCNYTSLMGPCPSRNGQC